MTPPMTTTRETAEHAELARLAEAATLGKWQNGIDDCEGVVAIAEHAGNVICLPPSDDMQASLEFWPDNAAFIAAANPATVLGLLSEIAALKGQYELDSATIQTLADQATQAERQRDEAFELLREIKRGDIHQEGDDIDNHVAGSPHRSRAWIGDIGLKIRAFLANQGTDQ